MPKLEAPITELAGVGAARAQALARLGITTLGELLYHFPRGYQFRGNVKRLADATDGETASFVLTVAAAPSLATLRRGMQLVKLRAFDDSGVCEITYFNQPYMKDSLIQGCEYRFFGKLQIERGKYLLASPIAEQIVEEQKLPELVAVYPLTAGITQKLISSLAAQALRGLVRGYAAGLPDPIPDKIREENHLCTLDFALESIHFPPDFEALSIAKRRLIFEEFYTFALGAKGSRSTETRLAPSLPDSDITPLTAQLPFELTGAQERAISAIADDLAQTKPMRRLVSGDVGSGKTAVAAAAALIAVRNGGQCAIMAPTEILASQHFADLRPLFEKTGINCRLLTGSTKAKERREIIAGLASESAEGQKKSTKSKKSAEDGASEQARVDIVIGTHALISEDVKFDRLGLVICDEQHRFGVGQREALLAKGSDEKKTVHQLSMSATPIPRTLALFLYGDLDMSVLDEMPPGRQRVKTFVVNEGYRERLNGFIRKQRDEGHQTYIVCPAVEEIESGEVSQEDIRLLDFGYDAEELMNGGSQPKAATAWVEYLRGALPDLRFGCVHGRLKSAEKDETMRAFASGELDVLVATTVIEVGVNVPNATLMIIENAERFGLSQLHQLRGRVGRGSAAASCVLVSNSKQGSRAADRLEVMRTTFDGYKIAEFDLSERGPGDFIPHGDQVRQHGDLKFRLGSLCDDMSLLEAAVRAANSQCDETNPLANSIVGEGLKLPQ